MVAFQGDQPVKEWYSLVNPQDDFDAINVSIHGLDEWAVKDAQSGPKCCLRLNLSPPAVSLSVTHRLIVSPSIGLAYRLGGQLPN